MRSWAKAPATIMVLTITLGLLASGMQLASAADVRGSWTKGSGIRKYRAQKRIGTRPETALSMQNRTDRKVVVRCTFWLDNRDWFEGRDFNGDPTARWRLRTDKDRVRWRLRPRHTQTRRVRLSVAIEKRLFDVYDEKTDTWTVEEGEWDWRYWFEFHCRGRFVGRRSLTPPIDVAPLGSS